MLENVDRLLKSPAKQRGRDFGIILACFRDEGYTVEWRVINAADYGYQQRRRRTFIFAYRNDTNYANEMIKRIAYNNNPGTYRDAIANQINDSGFFAETFPIETIEAKKITITTLPQGIGELSSTFAFNFENSGVMRNGEVYTIKTNPDYNGKQITLGDVMEVGEVEDKYFIPEDKLYYTNPKVNSNDERTTPLTKEERQTWQYLKGGKKSLEQLVMDMNIYFQKARFL